MYNGALADLRLGSDPWNTNRYAFAGGNPISNTDLDGHVCGRDRDLSSYCASAGVTPPPAAATQDYVPDPIQSQTDFEAWRHSRGDSAAEADIEYAQGLSSDDAARFRGAVVNLHEWADIHQGEMCSVASWCAPLLDRGVQETVLLSTPVSRSGIGIFAMLRNLLDRRALERAAASGADDVAKAASRYAKSEERGANAFAGGYLGGSSRLFGNETLRGSPGLLNSPGAAFRIGWSVRSLEGLGTRSTKAARWTFRLTLPGGQHYDLFRGPFLTGGL